MAAPGRTTEFGLIARYLAPLAAAAPGALGLLDDAALVAVTAGRQVVVTTDCMVAGVHFVADDPPERIAAKLLRVNLSDLAAMGAAPYGYLLSAAWPRDLAEPWIASFAAGLADDQRRYGIVLLGGDTVATAGPPVLTVTALGQVEEGRALLRRGARPGDAVYVSGTIGDAGLGLALRLDSRPELTALALAAADRTFLIDRLQLPEPRLRLGRELTGLAHAAIDVSDGLVADLGHICAVSGVGAEIAAPAVPLSAAAASVVAALPDLLSELLTAGDDYELCFTMDPADEAAVRQAGTRCGVPVTRIGEVVAEPGVRVRDAAGRIVPIAAGGFQHF